MRIQIRHRYNYSVLFECEADSMKIAVKLAIKAKANLSGANLFGANLSRANLLSADLSRADLLSADLSGANIDFSCWPLWCGSKKVKVDIGIVYQLIAHLCVLECDDKIFKRVQKFLLPFAKKFHRWGELSS